MSHQNSKGGLASVYPYGIVNHHNKPEEHEPQKKDVDYNSLEEALLGDS